MFFNKGKLMPTFTRTQQKMLQDTFGRTHDYLRISLTDQCNFRCQYCIPHEDFDFMPSSKLMSANEINSIAGEFVRLGVKKIRLTGGEPLLRKDFEEIVSLLSQYPVELTITTNGYNLQKHLHLIKKVGIKTINVSLDTLQSETFLKLTKRPAFEKVWNNINLLYAEGLNVKINTVVMRGVNELEIPQFIELTKERSYEVRFIEFMPFKNNAWENNKVFSYQEILETIELDYECLAGAPNDTAKKFKIKDYKGSFAIISTMTAPFCNSCNRLRLTADGKMKNCLFSKGEADILGAMRNGIDIIPIIEQCLLSKAEKLGGQLNENYKNIDASVISNRSMIKIGG